MPQLGGGPAPALGVLGEVSAAGVLGRPGVVGATAASAREAATEEQVEVSRPKGGGISKETLHAAFAEFRGEWLRKGEEQMSEVQKHCQGIGEKLNAQLDAKIEYIVNKSTDKVQSAMSESFRVRLDEVKKHIDQCNAEQVKIGKKQRDVETSVEKHLLKVGEELTTLREEIRSVVVKGVDVKIQKDLTEALAHFEKAKKEAGAASSKAEEIQGKRQDEWVKLKKEVELATVRVASEGASSSGVSPHHVTKEALS